jgi:hypothetical protein
VTRRGIAQESQAIAVSRSTIVPIAVHRRSSKNNRKVTNAVVTT